MVKKDYKKAKEAGYLDPEKLDGVGKYNSRLMAIKHPKIYVFLRPLHDLRNTVKPAVSKAARVISPRYRQRIEAIEKVGKLHEIHGELSAKVSDVECKIEEEDEES